MYISCIFHVVCASFSALATRELANAKAVFSGIWAYLDEEPGGDEGEPAVLPVEAVVVGVEGEVVEVEEAQPVPLTDVGVTADGVVLVSDPHDQDDVKRCRRVVKEFGHDGLHSCGSEQKWCLNMYLSLKVFLLI